MGITLDSTLTFKKHIKKTQNTLKYNIANFRHIRNSLTTQAAKTYLHAVILPYILYCVSSWSQADKTTLNPIRSLYNQALKVMDRKPRRYHHCHILEKHKLLSLDNLIIYSNIRLVHKIIHGAAPPPLKAFVQLRSDAMSRTSRSTSRGDCDIPKRTSDFSKSAFSSKAIPKWNDLPDHIKILTSYQDFSREAKNSLISNQVCCH